MWDNLILETIHNKKLETRMTYAQLANHFFNDATLGESLRLALRRYKKTYSIPDPEPRLFEPELTISNATSLVIADLHTPYQNKELLETAIQLAIHAKVEDVYIAGDIHDFNSLSSLNKGEATTDYEIDIKHSRQILYVLLRIPSIKRIIVMSGNHDEYYTKKKGVDFKTLIYQEVLLGRHSDSVLVTNYDYVFRGDDWIIGHLQNYDETPGLLAATLADKYNRHVLVGHDHIRGYMRGKNGKLGVSIGAMLQPDRFYYKARRLNTFPHFQLGFALLTEQNGLYLFSDSGNTTYNGAIKDFNYWIQYFKEGKHNDL